MCAAIECDYAVAGFGWGPVVGVAVGVAARPWGSSPSSDKRRRMASRCVWRARRRRSAASASASLSLVLAVELAAEDAGVVAVLAARTGESEVTRIVGSFDDDTAGVEGDDDDDDPEEGEEETLASAPSLLSRRICFAAAGFLTPPAGEACTDLDGAGPSVGEPGAETAGDLVPASEPEGPLLSADAKERGAEGGDMGGEAAPQRGDAFGFAGEACGSGCSVLPPRRGEAKELAELSLLAPQALPLLPVGEERPEGPSREKEARETRSKSEPSGS